MFAVCKWLGNSPTVAKQHYLHLTNLDFDRATGIDQPASRGKMRATAGQKAGQQGAARRRITTHLELANIKKALQTQGFCIEDGTIGTLTILTQVPPKGFEDVSNHRGNEEFSTGADTNVIQLADLKALLSSIDPIILGRRSEQSWLVLCVCKIRW